MGSLREQEKTFKDNGIIEEAGLPSHKYSLCDRELSVTSTVSMGTSSSTDTVNIRNSSIIQFPSFLSGVLDASKTWDNRSVLFGNKPKCLDVNEV
ncbi:hypothetical protein TNIN_118781 [Trichonephila inaurata madagascariensis]|uniref:Uncharacterized protein n=1 Tax=Trichonephila inaurata madagascariensis TaxID=2747483 RepID=A0A8X6XIL8_9ARAC|nr:hypothetical protein TNIN_118781 [Trichonephila inaurata madagascariensis]